MQHVTVKELATRLKMDRSAALKYVKRLGYVPMKRRTASSGYQTASVLTSIQAEEIYRRRKAEGYC
jgi:predicted transcriptional regulator